MIKIRKYTELDKTDLDRLFNRFGTDFSSIMIDTVAPIVQDVKSNGDSAVKKYTSRFDGVDISSITATPDEIEKGFQNTPGELLSAFSAAAKNIEEFHLRQKREDIQYDRNGITLGVKYEAIERAAVYVPGGKASYPSSVMMGVIPAKIAGTEDITVITPPGKDGMVPDIICAVCKMLGVTRVLKSGGAQGIAAAGLGTETIPASDIIVGPGNIYVTAAKTYLFSLGLIQIDSLAGPSEVLIISDGSADPKWIAWDLLSQAEHEEMATAVLLTTDIREAEAVKAEIIKDIESGAGRHEIKKKALTRSDIIVMPDVESAIEFSNRYAPEHMEFAVKNPMAYLNRIRNVGSLFLGDHSPVSVGDYYSGTNHILPTGGAARFSSGTSVDTFIRRTTFQLLNREALSEARGPVNIMSGAEGFDDKHGGSINVRFED